MEIKDIRRLSMPDAQAFIHQHQHEQPHELVLSWRGRTDLPLAAIAEQISCRNKAKRKLPSLATTGFLFEKVALSQSTGEAVARFKRGLMKGTRLIDCTGGLGVDTLFLREKFGEVIYCEQSEFRRMLFKHNKTVRHADNVGVSEKDCVQTLHTVKSGSFDWAYIDPSRRNESRRFVGLHQCEPDVIELEDLLVEKARQVCVKVSPALEIEEAEKSLKWLYGVAAVSVEGECKEILLFLRKASRKDERIYKKAYLLDDRGAVVFAITKQQAAATRKIRETGTYFYEPDPALIKADVLTEVAERFDLSFIHEYSAYMTADDYVKDFPGRSFEVQALSVWNRKKFKRYLEEHSIAKAHVSRRWFPLSVEEIRARFGLKDGGEDYFFFTRDMKGCCIVVHCRKAGAPHSSGRKRTGRTPSPW